MSLRLLPDGRPGEDLGIGHTLKHYLSPTEMWEDVAQDVALHLRPRAVADAWSGVRLWEVAQDPSAPVRDGWERLRAVYRDGYGALVQEAMTRLGEPTTGETSWVRLGRQWRGLDEVQALQLWVVRSGDGWRMYTAFRPAMYPYRDHACPPRDAKSVSLRKKISLCKARQQHARWAAQAGSER